MSSKPYDQAFKYLAEQYPLSLMILLGCLREGERARIRHLPRELNISTLLPDQIYLIETGQETFIAHIEAQTIYDPIIPQRMAEYGARLWMKHRLPLRSFVLLLTSRGLPERVIARGEIIAGDLKIKTRYRLVKLWQVSARVALATGRDNLIPFVPLMRGGEAEMEQGAQRLGSVEDYRQQRDLSLHFIVLGGLRYNRDDILELVGRRGMIPLDQLKESSMYKYIVEEGVKEGIEKGIKKGIEKGIEKGIKKGIEKGIKEGRKEGQAQGFAQAILLFVSERFPGVDVSEQIKRIKNPDTLQKLYADIIKMSDASELKKRLSRIAKSSR